VSDDYFFFVAFFREDLRLAGTFAPERRASDKPIAIACLRLVTFLPELPLRSVPDLRSSIARLTLAPARFPYFLAIASLRLATAVKPARNVPGAFH
jgi:hypothetical protein